MTVPLSFEYKGKSYSGELIPMAGGEFGWQVMLNGYYYGNLLYQRGWRLDDSELSELAEYLGEVLTKFQDSLQT